MIAQHSTTDLLKQTASAGQTHFTAAQVQSLQVRLCQDVMQYVLVFLCPMVKWPWPLLYVFFLFLSVCLCLCVILCNFKIDNFYTYIAETTFFLWYVWFFLCKKLTYCGLFCLSYDASCSCLLKKKLKFICYMMMEIQLTTFYLKISLICTYWDISLFLLWEKREYREIRPDEHKPTSASMVGLNQPDIHVHTFVHCSTKDQFFILPDIDMTLTFSWWLFQRSLIKPAMLVLILPWHFRVKAY